MAAEFRDDEKKARLDRLLREQRVAKHGAEHFDKYGLLPVRKGWIRGQVMNLVRTEEPCEYGTLVVMEFEVRDKPKQPGVPVRMAGTYFDNVMREGAIIDVADPDPAVRPIPAVRIEFSHHGGTMSLEAHYPGRRMPPPRRSVILAAFAIVVPVATLVTIVLLLRHYHAW